MLKLVKKAKKPVTLKDHYERRNRVLIKRRAGGFGDILMQRMMFEDFYAIMPELKLSFTCPIHYLEMAKDHPYLVEAVDLNSVDEHQYGMIYDITTACRVHESRWGDKNQDHRSDIWAAVCGVSLTKHNMHLEPQPEMLKICEEYLNHYRRGPTVLLSTQSTKDDFGTAKSLTDEQITGLVNGLRNRGYLPFVVHHEDQQIYDNLNVLQINGKHPQAWVAFTALADYVISVDTATFHLAGGLKKPLVGVFTFTDGKVYGKYYNFVLVQKHRDNGDWDCGPCFNLALCPKEKTNWRKPCLTELTAQDILAGFDELVAQKRSDPRRSLPVL